MAEVFSFPEGRLYLWAAYISGSANTANSGSSIAFAMDSTLSLKYGWADFPCADGTWQRGYTAKRAELSIAYMFAEMALYRLCDSGVVCNARFEAYNSALSASAQWTLYSGVIDSYNVVQSDGASFKGSLAFHANAWSAVGQ